MWSLIWQVFALIFHVVWFTYLAGQTWPGAFLQNFPLLMQLPGQIAASTLQGKAEKKCREDNPGRFPPAFEDYLKQAYKRWRDEVQHPPCTIRLLPGLP